MRGGKYFFVRNGTTILSFAIGSRYERGNGVITLGAHTDSPCFRIQPVACSTKSDAIVLNTFPYGGGLWHTWFDRDLGLAGRIFYNDENDEIKSKLVRIENPIARIPCLAIHLTSGSERESFSPNLHEHCKAIFTLSRPGGKGITDSTANISNISRLNTNLVGLLSKSASVPDTKILDAELQLTDVQPSCFGGLENELIFSGRLDNL